MVFFGYNNEGLTEGEKDSGLEDITLTEQRKESTEYTMIVINAEKQTSMMEIDQLLLRLR